MRTRVEQELTLYTLKLEDLNDTNLKDKIQSCKHFHVVSEIKKAILKVFSFAKKHSAQNKWKKHPIMSQRI